MTVQKQTEIAVVELLSKKYKLIEFEKLSQHSHYDAEFETFYVEVKWRDDKFAPKKIDWDWMMDKQKYDALMTLDKPVYYCNFCKGQLSIFLLGEEYKTVEGIVRPRSYNSSDDKSTDVIMIPHKSAIKIIQNFKIEKEEIKK